MMIFQPSSTRLQQLLTNNSPVVMNLKLSDFVCIILKHLEMEFYVHSFLCYTLKLCFHVVCLFYSG